MSCLPKCGPCAEEEETMYDPRVRRKSVFNISDMGKHLLGMDKSVVAPKKTREGTPVSCKATWGEWSQPDYTVFKIRGPNYMRDKVKIPASPFKFDLVHVDLWKSNEKIRNMAERKNSFVKEYRSNFSKPPFLFVINFLVPFDQNLNLVAYHVLNETPDDSTAWGRNLKEFITGDDSFRNARFKFIPHIVHGPWLVKKTVGMTPAILGDKLDTMYFGGEGYMEVCCDVTSSSIARKMLKIVGGQSKRLAIDLTFLIEGQDKSELPEAMLAGMTIGHSDMKKAVPLPK